MRRRQRRAPGRRAGQRRRQSAASATSTASRLSRRGQQRPRMGGRSPSRTGSSRTRGCPAVSCCAHCTPRVSDPEPHSSGTNHSAAISATRDRDQPARARIGSPQHRSVQREERPRLGADQRCRETEHERLAPVAVEAAEHREQHQRDQQPLRFAKRGTTGKAASSIRPAAASVAASRPRHGRRRVLSAGRRGPPPARPP